MRNSFYLLCGLLALTLQLASASAHEFNHNDPDTWSPAYARYIASHLFADKQPDDAISGKQFIIVCDPDFINFSYIGNLKRLASLQEAHSRGYDNNQYPCIQKNSLRLDRPSGQTRAQQKTDPEYDKDIEGWFAVSYKVVKEDANSQIVEVRYRNHSYDIYDSFFKYEVRADKITPLESWVVDKWLVLFIVGVMLVLVFLLSIVGVFRLFRFLKSRYARR